MDHFGIKILSNMMQKSIPEKREPKVTKKGDTGGARGDAGEALREVTRGVRGSFLVFDPLEGGGLGRPFGRE